MRIIAGILSVAVLMWVEAASAQKASYSLSVSQHRAVPALSEGEVDAILARASKMLQKNSRHDDDDDVACNVTFTLEGPIRTFGSAGTPEVVDKDHIAAVHRVDSNVAGDFHVKVVEEIHFCRLDLPAGLSFEGCSYSPPKFRSMIVVHPRLHKDAQGHNRPNFPNHLLWAHEFGHLAGLGHRPKGDKNALMTPCSLAAFSNLPDTSVQVNQKECRCLVKGPAGCQLPPKPITCQ
jgi:hypothetical protein